MSLLAKILAQAPVLDERVVLWQGIGIDCAVVDIGPRYLVFKSDPITFTSDEIGWYVVQVNANDIATTGAVPRWFLCTHLLPEGSTTEHLALQISEQVNKACRELGISVIGGHSEITHGLDRPILVGTMIGEVEREHLVTPRGASPDDRILLTKGVPIEATSILAREFPERLRSELSAEELHQAAKFLYDPGISVVRDAQVAMEAGRITAMHDPTEGGLASALWEMAVACGHSLVVDIDAVFIPPLSGRICRAFGLNPLATIASGALLLTATAGDAKQIRHALEAEEIRCNEIGSVEAGPAEVWNITNGNRTMLPCPVRDEIGSIYE